MATSNPEGSAPAERPPDVVLTRDLPAEPTLVRGLLHELASVGEWQGLAQAAAAPVQLRVHDAGAGGSTIEVRQHPGDKDTGDVEAFLVSALDELERRLVQRTSDAS